MSGASRTLDPIEAAEAGIAGSKNLIAAVADDLSQQQRWLAHYQVAEKRHARRVKFQELIYWLELRRRRLVRWSRRIALTSLRGARAAAAFLWRTAVTLFVILRRVATACFALASPAGLRARADLRPGPGLLAGRPPSFGCSPAPLKAAAIASAWIAQAHPRRDPVAMALVAWAWTRIEAARLARAAMIKRFDRCGLERGPGAGAGDVATPRDVRLAASLRRETSRLASWTNKKAGHFSRASLATASLGFSWTKQAGQHADVNHRALVVRRCTALISFEPRRARLPALIGPDAPHPISSRAGRASP